MRFRLTPLNIVTALGLAMLVFLLFQPKSTVPRHLNLSGFYMLILSCLIAITFVTDMIFRFTLKDLKRIWLVELIFISLTIILFLLLKK